MDLPLDLLRTFLAIADTGSVTRAAGRVHRTQPAVSLQMRRLEGLAGRKLLAKSGRNVVPTPAGLVLLDHARALIEAHDRTVAALAAEPLAGPVRFGMIQDFADDPLPQVLARFSRQHPEVRLRVQVAGSAALRQAVADGALDLALVVAAPGEPVLRPRPMRWLGAPALAAADPLPLALLDPPCDFRDAAIAALEAAGRPWRLVVSGPSLPAVTAAVRAGLALTVRTGGPAIAGLPPLPATGFTLLTRPAGAAAHRLATIITEEICP